MDVTAVAEAISSRVGAFDGLGDDRPMHLLVRAAVLVGDEDLVYVDDNLSRSLDSPAWSGDILIFTDERVIRLTVSQPEAGSGQGSDTSAEATAWGRASLREVAALGIDQAWGDASSEGLAETTGLRLSYTDGQVVEIPSRWEAGAARGVREGVAELLPSLWSDLAAGA